MTYTYTYSIQNDYNVTNENISKLEEHLKIYYFNFQLLIDSDMLIFNANAPVDKAQLVEFIKSYYVKQRETINLLTIPVDINNTYWKTIIEWSTHLPEFALNVRYIGNTTIHTRVVNISNNTIYATTSTTVMDTSVNEILINLPKDEISGVMLYELQSYVNEKYIKIKSINLNI